MNKKIIALVIVAVLVIVGAYLIFKPAKVEPQQRYGGTTNLDALTLGANATGPGMNTQVASGVCSTASTTLFAVNPFYGIGTSTATVSTFYGTQGATTTDIVIGTSTTPYSGLDASNYNNAILKMNLMNLASVATGTQFFASSGSDLNSLSAATGTNMYGTSTRNKMSIVVGPTQYVIANSTSTSFGLGGGSIASGFQPIPTSCSYNIKFQR